MKIKEVKFVKSVSINSEEVFFDDKPEIIFVWRSNVWKSSIMNAIFWTKDLVKTSSTPGKTRTANMFIMNNKYYFTDLPWYWFAKLWKTLKEDLDKLISWYIEERKPNIKSVVMLIDSKLWPQDTDLDMYKYLLELWMPLTVVLTKIDKLWTWSVKESIRYAEDKFFWQKIFAVSSYKWIWVRELFNELSEKILAK